MTPAEHSSQPTPASPLIIQPREQNCKQGDSIGAAAENYHNVGLFVAEGGEVYMRSSIIQAKDDNNIFQVVTSEYRVALGNENRTAVLYGCVYPLEVTVSEFRTEAGTNDKVLKAEGSNIWRIWDVTENKIESAPLTYSHQAGGFYYFEEDSIENNVIGGKDQWRISFLGGLGNIRISMSKTLKRCTTKCLLDNLVSQDR
jgi:hypothetical protein